MNISLKASEKEADQMADFADTSVFAGAGECAAMLLDEAAQSEEAKAELNGEPTKKLFASFRLCVNSMRLFCQVNASLHR